MRVAPQGLLGDEGPELDFEEALSAILELVGQKLEVTVVSLNPLGVVAEFYGVLRGGGDIRYPARAVEGEAFRCEVGEGSSFSVEERLFRGAGWVRVGSASGSLRLYLGSAVVELTPAETPARGPGSA